LGILSPVLKLATYDNPYWLIESVYASVEVNSELSPQDISDCIEKCKRSKGLRRDWTNTRTSEIASPVLRPRRVLDSLFLIWVFGGPSNQTVIDNLSSAFEKVPNLERADLILMNDRFCAFSGSLQLLFQAQRDYFIRRDKFVGGIVELANQPNIIAFECGSNALLLFLFCPTQWLQSAAPRLANAERIFGQI
jgi:hypothetical protein